MKFCVNSERRQLGLIIYFPGKSQDVIPQVISDVDIFLVLNEYFDAQLEFLDECQYFMNGYFLFDLQDVKNRINDSCVAPE